MPREGSSWQSFVVRPFVGTHFRARRFRRFPEHDFENLPSPTKWEKSPPTARDSSHRLQHKPAPVQFSPPRSSSRKKNFFGAGRAGFSIFLGLTSSFFDVRAEPYPGLACEFPLESRRNAAVSRHDWPPAIQKTSRYPSSAPAVDILFKGWEKKVFSEPDSRECSARGKVPRTSGVRLPGRWKCCRRLRGKKERG